MPTILDWKLSPLSFTQDTKEKSSGIFFPILYVGILSALIFALFNGWGYDDPYITYRYADNLANGDGFVYNLGENVLSTTSPLFTLILALLKPLWADTQKTALLIGSLSLSLGGLFLWKLGEHWQKRSIAWAGLLVFPIFPLLLQTLSSETPLYLFLSIVALYHSFRGRYSTSFIFGAFSTLTRPEGLLLLAILVVYHIIKQRGLPVIPLLLAMLIILPWVIFATLNFGSPVPATLSAKQHQGSLVESERILSRIPTILEWGYVQRWNYWFGLGLVILGIAAIRRRDIQITMALIWSASHIIALAVLGVSGYFWYYAPLVPGLIIAAGNGIDFISKTLRTKLEIRLWIMRSASFFVAVALVAPTISQVFDLKQNPDRRLKIYRAIGEWVEANTEADASIGALEVGIIGYYGKRRMIDFAGVIQPSIAEQLTPTSSYTEATTWAIQIYKPDYLILSSSWSSTLMDGYVNPHCRSIKTFSGTEFGYGGNFNIYTCDWAV